FRRVAGPRSRRSGLARDRMELGAAAEPRSASSPLREAPRRAARIHARGWRMNARQSAIHAPHPAVAEALRAMLGDASYAIEPLGGGLSKAALYKVTTGARAYVVRRMRGARAGEEGSDPRREIACMTLAAERGVAPRVLHADASSGVCITDFIDAP